MSDAKSIVNEFRKKQEPQAYRWKASRAPAVPGAPQSVTSGPAAADQPLAEQVQQALSDLKHHVSDPETVEATQRSFEVMAQSIAALTEDIEARSDAESGQTSSPDMARDKGGHDPAADPFGASASLPQASPPALPVATAVKESVVKRQDEAPVSPSGSASTVLDARSAPQNEPVDRGGNLLADVRAIAASWFRNGRAADRINRGPGDVAMPEELTAAGADRGVSVSYAEKPLKDLTDRDFPCIALDKTGASHILVGKPDKTTVLKQQGDVTSPVPLGRLQKILSGVVFFVKPKAEQPAEAPTRTGAVAVEVTTLSGIFRTVTQEILATQRPLLVQLVLATVLSNLFMFAMPLFSMAVYDRVVPHLAWETLWALSLGVMIILAADFAIRYIRIKLMDSVGLTTATVIQARMFSRLLHGKMKDLPNSAGGVANGVREVEALCHVVPALMISVVIDLPFFVLAAVLIYSIAGFAAVAPVLGALVLVGVHVLNVVGEDAANKHSRFVGSQTNALLETMGAIETVKLTGAERILLRRWERLNDAAAFASHRNRLQGNFAGQASVVIAQVVTVFAMIIGVYEISNGTMTIGAMTAAVLLIGRMMSPISQMMALVHRAHQLTSAAQTMSRILATPQEVAGDSSEIREETPIAGHLSFRNVNFTYPGEQTPSLEGITLDIRPGEKIGLIGRVGSGKSTLLRLMLRLYEPSAGAMLVDGTDVRQLSPRALRRAFGFMRQDSVLFDDTLQANICFGMESLRTADFERAVNVSGVKEFAARNPAGYGMRVGSRGERLSGGERQSVALARLLTENPATLVLDEPTSAMDNALEAKIVRDLREVIADKTLIVATHRAPLLSLVDRIIWMENGRIVADGPKAEVLQRLTQSAA